MVSTLNPSEEAQLAQTIEMFEVITQSQPHDFQSLEILREAYSKLGRDRDVIGASKRLAQAYVQSGRISSAILEYETILQCHPNDRDAQEALQQLEDQANNLSVETIPAETSPPPKATGLAEPASGAAGKAPPPEVEDGRRMMLKIFVESRIITADDFNLCWSTPDPLAPPGTVLEPFIQVLADRGILAVDKSLRMLCDKSRAAFLPLKSYDIDLDLTRTFPAETCHRWCVLPFDRMSKSVFVATANPFNQQAAKELAEATPNRLLWYLVPPMELVTIVRKAFR
jgi:hypothetical protein